MPSPSAFPDASCGRVPADAGAMPGRELGRGRRAVAGSRRRAWLWARGVGVGVGRGLGCRREGWARRREGSVTPIGSQVPGTERSEPRPPRSDGRRRPPTRVFAPNASTVHVSASPADCARSGPPDQLRPSPGIARSMISSPGFASREHHPSRSPQAMRSRRDDASFRHAARRATRPFPAPGAPFIQSRSTGPSMPGILPAAEYCQTVYPRPAQRPPGTSGRAHVPVRHPEGMPLLREPRRVAHEAVPEVVARVDHRPHTRARVHAGEPCLRPGSELPWRQSPGLLDVEHRERRLPRARRHDVEEVIGFRSRVPAGEARLREVIGADGEAVLPRTGCVAPVLTVPVVVPERRAHDHESDGRRGDRAPIDPALVLGDVDARHFGAGDSRRLRQRLSTRQSTRARPGRRRVSSVVRPTPWNFHPPITPAPTSAWRSTYTCAAPPSWGFFDRTGTEP